MDSERPITWGGGRDSKCHAALTNQPADVLATEPTRECEYGMGSKFLSRFRHLKSPKVRSRGAGRPKSTQEFSPHTVTIFPGWLCGQNICGLICKSPVTLKSRPPPT